MDSSTKIMNETLKKEIQALKQKVQELSNFISSISSSSSFPLQIEKVLTERGFLKSDKSGDNLIVSGEATLTVGGEAWVPLPGVSINAIAFAVYADPTLGSDIGSTLINNSGVLPNTTQLYLFGTGTKQVYWVVFKTANKTL